MRTNSFFKIVYWKTIYAPRVQRLLRRCRLLPTPSSSTSGGGGGDRGGRRLSASKSSPAIAAASREEEMYQQHRAQQYQAAHLHQLLRFSIIFFSF